MQDGTKATVTTKTIESLNEPVKVYNFTVDEFHTYFLGENSMLVHNSCFHGTTDVDLPKFDGKTTKGVLILDDGSRISLSSGNGDPRYTNYRNNGHVEQKAALYIRENNLSNGTLYHNNKNGTCGYCNTMTATFLPENATLTVVPPQNAIANNSRAIDYTKTYVGTSNNPKISSRYKG